MTDPVPQENNTTTSASQPADVAMADPDTGQAMYAPTHLPDDDVVDADWGEPAEDWRMEPEDSTEQEQR